MENTSMSDLLNTENIEMTDITPETAQYCIKFEKPDKDELGPRTPQGITTDVTVVDVKPEQQGIIKTENVSNITESFDVKPDPRHDLVSNFCQIKKDRKGDCLTDNFIQTEHVSGFTSEQTASLPEIGSNVAVKQILKLEKVDEDPQGSFLSLEITKEISLVDVKPEHHSSVKQENIINIAEPVDVKEGFRPDLVQTMCHLQDDEADVKSECLDNIVQQTATLGETMEEAKITEAIITASDAKLNYITYRNSGQAPEACIADNNGSSIKKDFLIENEGKFGTTNRDRGNLGQSLMEPSGENSGSNIKKPFPIKNEGKFGTVSNDKGIHDRFSSKDSLTHFTFPDGSSTVIIRSSYNTDSMIKKANTISGDRLPYLSKSNKTCSSIYASTESFQSQHDKPHECSYCGKSFCTKYDLTTHVRTHTGEKPFSCPYCERRFSHKGSLLTHIRTHTGEKPFPCPHCDKRFSIASSLTIHIRTHTGEKLFSCPHCEKRTGDQSSLAKHIRTHTGEKLSCPHCVKHFSNYTCLNTHIRSHTGEKPFPCPYCDKRFSAKTYLSKHVRRHTGEKPFSCPYCDKRFIDSSAQITHVRMHTGEKPFLCPYCDKPFRIQTNLTKHIRVHTGEKPFSCPVCDKRFTAKSTVSTHIRTHTGEKPFSCSHCTMRFSDKSALTQHMRRHTGEKPVSCAHCDKRFSSKNSLTTHMRKHTHNNQFSPSTSIKH